MNRFDSFLEECLREWDPQLKVDLEFPAIGQRNPFDFIKNPDESENKEKKFSYAVRERPIGEDTKRTYEIETVWSPGHFCMYGVLMRMTSPMDEALVGDINLYTEEKMGEMATAIMSYTPFQDMMAPFTMEDLDSIHRINIADFYVFKGKFKSSGAPVQLVVMPWGPIKIPKKKHEPQEYKGDGAFE